MHGIWSETAPNRENTQKSTHAAHSMPYRTQSLSIGNFFLFRYCCCFSSMYGPYLSAYWIILSLFCSYKFWWLQQWGGKKCSWSILKMHHCLNAAFCHWQLIQRRKKTQCTMAKRWWIFVHCRFIYIWIVIYLMMEFEYFTTESRLIHNDTTIITAEFVTECTHSQKRNNSAHKCTLYFRLLVLFLLFFGYGFIFT